MRIHSHLRSSIARYAIALLPLMACTTTLVADDRDLFLNSSRLPYVFVILDTSGSMNWALEGGYLYADDNPNTTNLPGSADDYRSRAYQAKSALYEVVRDIDPRIRLGFAHFAQPSSQVYAKHWLYTADVGQGDPPWLDELPFPTPGEPVRFGNPLFDNDGVVRATFGSCSSPDTRNTPDADLVSTERFRRDRLNMYPKLGHDGQLQTTFYTRYQGADFRVRFMPLGADQALGDEEIDLEIRVLRCADQTEEVHTVRMVPFYEVDTKDVPLDGASDMLSEDYDLLDFDSVWDFLIERPCAGWEDNSGSRDGMLAYTTFEDPLNRETDDGFRPFDRGDMLPWDWADHEGDDGTSPPGFDLTNREEIMRRLAPNIASQDDYEVFGNDAPPGFEPGERIPDFRIARYFENEPVGGFLPLKADYVEAPPIAFYGATPLGASIMDLRDWFVEWKEFATDPDTGDEEYLCRPRFLLLLTDGIDTCNNTDPADAAAALRTLGSSDGSNPGIRTVVVGFGPGVSQDALQGIADAGGSGTRSHYAAFGQDCSTLTYDTSDGVQNLCPGPVVAENRDKLVEVLKNIFTALTPAESAFAGAALPSGSSGADQSIVLNSLLPIPDSPFWRGSLNLFKRPLPVEQLSDGSAIPDTGRACPPAGSDEEAVGCFAWNAGEVMLDQAPLAADVQDGDAQTLQIGTAVDERRLFWAQHPREDEDGALSPLPGVPVARQWLVPRTANPTMSENDVQFHLWREMGLDFDSDVLDQVETADTRVRRAIENLVARKEAEDPLAEGSPAPIIEWILGDIFHSTPFYLANPEVFEYLITSAENNGEPCIDPDNDQPNLDATNYYCFAQKNRRRRHVVLAGANDAQIHAFDAGRWDSAEEQVELGSGREIFSFVPRELLRRVIELDQPGATHDYGADGPIWVSDYFIDPQHSGIPTAEDREWRTVALAGLREGGRTYWALDLTTPDPIEFELDDDGNRIFTPVYTSDGEIPACIGPGPGGSGDLPAGCDLPYPSVLWEFTDPDLGDTWSKPNTGRLQVLENGELATKYVAVLGGGIDTENPDRGQHLYVVDIETGRALYKRQLAGQVPSEPAAVDLDADGFLDTIYVGTTAGFMYKVDVGTPQALETNAADPDAGLRVWEGWDPFPIFHTDGRPIFFRPSVIYVANTGRFALAFGTGDREDLTELTGETGRFYALLDRGFTLENMVDVHERPNGFSESDLFGFDPSTLAENGDLLVEGSPDGGIPGYFMTLAADERLASDVFALSGVMVFTTFTPTESVDAEGCRSRGLSRVYSLFATSGNGLLDRVGTSSDSPRRRFEEQLGFGGNPWAELNATDTLITNDDEPGDPGDDDPGGGTSGPDGDLEEIQEYLKSLMPENCKFNNVSVDILIENQNLSIKRIVPVPLCTVQKNWKDL